MLVSSPWHPNQQAKGQNHTETDLKMIQNNIKDTYKKKKSGIKREKRRVSCNAYLSCPNAHKDIKGVNGESINETKEQMISKYEIWMTT